MKPLLSTMFAAGLLFNLNADECISFEDITNKSVIKPIINELSKLHVESRINAHDGCRYKVYLPIEVSVINDSGDQRIDVHLNIQKESGAIQDMVLHVDDTDKSFYNLKNSPAYIKNKLIKKHSRIIAKSLKKELF